MKKNYQKCVVTIVSFEDLSDVLTASNNQFDPTDNDMVWDKQTV